MSWLADWQSDLYGQLREPQRESDVDLSFWWQVFDDTTLNGLIETARRENPSLQIAGLRILESRAQLGIAGSNLYPQLQQVNGAATYIDTRRNGGQWTTTTVSRTTRPASISAGNWISGAIPARRGIGGRGVFRFDHQSAGRAGAAGRAGRRPVLSYRTTHALIDIARKNAEIQKRSLDMTERLYRGPAIGAGPATGQDPVPDDAVQCAAAGDQAHPDPQRPGDPAGASTRRHSGTGSGAKGTARVPRVSVDEIPARLLARRPDVRTAAWQVAAQSAQIGIAEADYYPAISLLGSIGWSGTSGGGRPDSTVLGGALPPGMSSTTAGSPTTYACRTRACSRPSRVSRTACCWQPRRSTTLPSPWSRRASCRPCWYGRWPRLSARWNSPPRCTSRATPISPGCWTRSVRCSPSPPTNWRTAATTSVP